MLFMKYETYPIGHIIVGSSIHIVLSPLEEGLICYAVCFPVL